MMMRARGNTNNVGGSDDGVSRDEKPRPLSPPDDSRSLGTESDNDLAGASKTPLSPGPEFHS